MTFAEFQEIVDAYKAKIYLTDRDIYTQARAFIEGQIVTYEVAKDDPEYTTLLDLQAKYTQDPRDALGGSFVSPIKPAVSGTKIKTHDFGDPSTWYSKSNRVTVPLGIDPYGVFDLTNPIDIKSPNLPFGQELTSYRVVVTDSLTTIYPDIVNNQITIPQMTGDTILTYSQYTDNEFIFQPTKECMVLDACILLDSPISVVPEFVFAIRSPLGDKTKVYRNLIDYLSESDLQDFKQIPSIAGSPAKLYFRWDYRQPIVMTPEMSLSLSLPNQISFSAVAGFSVQFK